MAEGLKRAITGHCHLITSWVATSRAPNGMLTSLRMCLAAHFHFWNERAAFHLELGIRHALARIRESESSIEVDGLGIVYGNFHDGGLVGVEVLPGFLPHRATDAATVIFR